MSLGIVLLLLLHTMPAMCKQCSGAALAAVLSASVAECHQHTKPEISTQQNLLKQNVLDGKCCKLVELLEWSISKASQLVCDVSMSSLM